MHIDTEQLPPTQTEEINDLIEPETSQRAITHLELTSEKMPTLLLIDGIVFDTATAIGQSLLVTNERQIVIATRTGELAIVRSERAYGGNLLSCDLTFTPLDRSIVKVSRIHLSTRTGYQC